MLIINFLILLVGLFLVVKGADILISSAVAIGKKYGVSDFFIGLIVIGFGTSLPELLVSIDAIIKKSPEISVGNVLGSNISNILLVLGSALLISKIELSKITRFDNLFHLFIHTVFLLIVWFLVFDYKIGLFFLILFTFYIYKSFNKSLSNSENELETNDFLAKMIFKNPLIIGLPAIIFSIILTFFGAEFTVDSVIKISSFFGISDSFLALTLVALGTSLPEIITSVRAAQKKMSELIIGNIIGSNIYNLLLILGFVSLFEAFTFPKEVLFFEVIFLFLCVVGFSLLLYFKKELNKKFSSVFIFFYFFYLLKLLLTNF
tara:strand:- start:9728 stop:10684 length:957 start_codon:yes stop_codon:yes gene_type:complete